MAVYVCPVRLGFFIYLIIYLRYRTQNGDFIQCYLVDKVFCLNVQVALLIKRYVDYIGIEPESFEPLKIALRYEIDIGEAPFELLIGQGQRLQFLELLAQQVHKLRREFHAVAVIETECAYTLGSSPLVVV